MDNGLQVNEEQFIKMKPVERDLIMYRNLRAVCDLHESTRLNQRIQYILITAALGGVGILFSIALKIL